jgi:ParB family transcriptional regulator, chromosome partitioning protein
MKKLNIQKVNIDLIRPYWRNARKNDETVKQLVKSIQEFGYVQPIAIDKENIIIAGHARYKALKQLGYTQIEVIILDLPERLAKQYRLADNKTAEQSSWDLDKLAKELEAIADPEFKLDFEQLFDSINANFGKLAKVDIQEKVTEVECPYCDHVFKI